LERNRRNRRAKPKWHEANRKKRGKKVKESHLGGLQLSRKHKVFAKNLTNLQTEIFYSMFSAQLFVKVCLPLKKELPFTALSIEWLSLLQGFPILIIFADLLAVL